MTSNTQALRAIPGISIHRTGHQTREPTSMWHCVRECDDSQPAGLHTSCLLVAFIGLPRPDIGLGVREPCFRVVCSMANTKFITAAVFLPVNAIRPATFYHDLGRLQPGMSGSTTDGPYQLIIFHFLIGISVWEWTESGS